MEYVDRGHVAGSYMANPSILPSFTSCSAAERSWGRSAGSHSGAAMSGCSLPSITPTFVVSVVPGNAPNMWLSERFSSITYTTCLIGQRVSTTSGDVVGASVPPPSGDVGGSAGVAPSFGPSSSEMPIPAAPAATTAPPATAVRFRKSRRETRRWVPMAVRTTNAT